MNVIEQHVSLKTFKPFKSEYKNDSNTQRFEMNLLTNQSYENYEMFNIESIAYIFAWRLMRLF